MTTLPGTPPSAEMEGGWTPKNTKAFVTWFLPMLLSFIASLTAAYFSYHANDKAATVDTKVGHVQEIVNGQKTAMLERIDDLQKIIELQRQGVVPIAPTVPAPESKLPARVLPPAGK